MSAELDRKAQHGRHVRLRHMIHVRLSNKSYAQLCAVQEAMQAHDTPTVIRRLLAEECARRSLVLDPAIVYSD